MGYNRVAFNQNESIYLLGTSGKTFFTEMSFQATPELTGVAAWTRAGNSRPTCHIPITVKATHPWRILLHQVAVGG